MSHLGSIQRGLGLGLGYKLMYEDGFLFAFILSVINLVPVWVHSEMLIFNIK